MASKRHEAITDSPSTHVLAVEASAEALAQPKPPPVAPESQLPRELGLLNEASRALDDRAPARAGQLLDRYEREFPAGGMQIEAMALRIASLVDLHQDDTARILAQQFLALHPESPAAVRVRAMLAGIDRRHQKP
jgi:outer membrane protein assembly factor BamD (BamD/ComL family)